MGTLGDRMGRRRLLLIGAAAFGAASTLAAFAPSAAVLILARGLLGVAGATLAPSTLSLLRNMFHDPRQRTFAIGVWVASFSAGAAIGPLIGGVLLAHFWWGSVFLVAVPLMLLLLVLGPMLLPEFRDPAAGRLDLPSAALSMIAVLAVIYGMKRIATYGATWPAALTIALGLGVGGLFLRRQQKLADPLIDLRLFRVPAFSAPLAINVLGLFTVFGCSLLIAQYLQLVMGLPPLAAGLWTAPSGVAFVAGSMLTPLIVRRIRHAYVIAGGLLISALGFGVLTQIGGNDGLLLLGWVVFCLGLTPVATLTTDLVVGVAPPERTGAASAISETSFELGGALGIAGLGSIAAAAYRRIMADAVHGLPTEAAGAARDTLTGALAAARELPGARGEELVGAARAAFTHSIALCAGICSAIAIVAAVLAVAILRRVPVSSADPA
jgi:DHA2 family multidrug resistance protein-like MFS transporter